MLKAQYRDRQQHIFPIRQVITAHAVPLATPFVRTAVSLCGGILLLTGAGAVAMPMTDVGAFQATDKQLFEPPDRGTPDALGTTGTRLFQPRRRDTPQGPTTSTGTRSGSCLNPVGANPGFAGLGPQFEAGLTSSSRPEFVWYMPASEQPFPIEFRLLTFDDADRPILLHSEAQFTYTAGFMTYQLPESSPALEVGRQYYWQVIVNCNPNRPSRALVSTLQFEVVTPSAVLNDALAIATTNVDLAIAYANDGLWYDALALVIDGETVEERQLRTRLLRDLADEEANSDTGSAQLSTDLTQIADATE